MWYLLALIIAFSPAGAAGNPSRVAAANDVRSQEPPVPPFEIAAPFPDETAFEVVGRVEHQDSSITSFGYLSTVAGIDRSMLYSASGSPSAATARFTYFARLNQLEESGSGDVSVTAVEGTLTVYFSEEGGSSLDIADTFFRGTPVATMQVQLVLQRDGPDSGVIIGEGNLTQVIDAIFSFDGHDYRFGHVGLQERFLFLGTTVSTQSGSTPVMESVAGHTTVTGSDVVPGTPASELLPEGAASAVSDNQAPLYPLQ